ncbi:MAG: hypothetical protein ACK53V_05575, partial [Planctomycetota bacterium]
TWFDRYARKIDELPVLNVDEAMIQFGQYVSDQFRDISTGLRGAELAKTQDATSYQNWSYSYRNGRWGTYSEYYDNSKARNTATSIDRQRGSNQAREVLEEVAKQSSKLRKDMSQKYNINF